MMEEMLDFLSSYKDSKHELFSWDCGDLS